MSVVSISVFHGRLEESRVRVIVYELSSQVLATAGSALTGEGRTGYRPGWFSEGTGTRGSVGSTGAFLEGMSQPSFSAAMM